MTKIKKEKKTILKKFLFPKEWVTIEAETQTEAILKFKNLKDGK